MYLELRTSLLHKILLAALPRAEGEDSTPAEGLPGKEGKVIEVLFTGLHTFNLLPRILT